jgi:hypothetical protein
VTGWTIEPEEGAELVIAGGAPVCAEVHEELRRHREAERELARRGEARCGWCLGAGHTASNCADLRPGGRRWP